MARIIKYKCSQCGSRIVLTEELESRLSPVYCCGLEVKEISSEEKKPAKPRKKASKKKVVKKKTTAKKTGRKK